MRLILPLLLLATPVMGEVFTAPAPVVSAVVYPEGAITTRAARLDLPAGRHIVLLPFHGQRFSAVAQQVEVRDGVEVLSLRLVPDMDVDREALMSDAQRSALAEVEALETQVAAQEERIGAAQQAAEARGAELKFIAAIRPPEAGAEPDALLALAELVQARTAQGLAARAAAEREVAGLRKALEGLQEELAIARRKLERLALPKARQDLLALEVNVVEPGPAVFTQKDAAGVSWAPSYTLHLTTEGTPELRIERQIIVQNDMQSPWLGVQVQFSTLVPDGTIAPDMPWPDQASIFEKAEILPLAERAMGGVMPMAAPEIVVEEAEASGFGTEIDGVAVQYAYGTPLTLYGGERLELALDALRLPVETEIHAAPRSDDTAYYMALVENDTGEPLLPGPARFYRDGHLLIGEFALDLIPAGGAATLGFGPVEGIRLSHVVARNETGDTGVFSRANTRVQEISFAVENLTGEAQEVTAFYPLVYSEQEDLEIRLDVVPRPDETDIDNRRGVSAWHMRLAPGERQEVQIKVRLDWPDGQELRWYP